MTEKFTPDQILMLKKMKDVLGYDDDTLNTFKLMIYDWDVDKAIKYYNTDSFCHGYCIHNNYNHGYAKQQNQCQFEHSRTINLKKLLYGNSQQKDYKKAKLLCLYLMYTKIHNDNNSQLFLYYATFLKRTGTEMQDYLQSEKYYLKSLSIDNNNDNAHASYGRLLKDHLNDLEKAQWHFERSIAIYPKNAARCYNFAMFLQNHINLKGCEVVHMSGIWRFSFHL